MEILFPILVLVIFIVLLIISNMSSYDNGYEAGIEIVKDRQKKKIDSIRTRLEREQTKLLSDMAIKTNPTKDEYADFKQRTAILVEKLNLLNSL